jgi:phospholipid/cholesterol/gamma-HCH transport system substrate-binding protein
MKGGAIETIVGFLVILTAAGFFAFVYNVSSSSKVKDGYLLKAHFQNIEGLTNGSDVKLSGIKIGYVDNIKLEKDTYFAIVDLRIEKDIFIPVDSRAAVSTSGLLGGKYIGITPGASEENLAVNGQLKFTQSALNLEDLISKLMYSVTSK